ncbi:hypothetical protein JHD49_04790 [Sulfurimonas sp. SAG-AH-194-C21]|nr:hypothetical protein [Sulfurimonas sp. SAG-AH-194-C21]MDF1883250.1 hypothetical protein [Sulfurimonas sp. SAG-AH-194-C21]
MKTKIKRANWKSKGMFSKKKYENIFTTVYTQGKDVFIDTDSKFLFQMVCENYFHQYPNAKLKITLEGHFGVMFPKAYRLYVYNLIYKELTGKKIKNDIFKVKKGKELFYRSMLDIHMNSYQRMVLKIIKILKIDFKKESDKVSRLLFNMGKKKDFYMSKE